MSTGGRRVLIDILQGSRNSLDFFLASLGVEGQLAVRAMGETRAIDLIVQVLGSPFRYQILLELPSRMSAIPKVKRRGS